MATLTQVKDEYTIFTGWYGDCSDNCNNFDLTQHLDVIYAVYEFKEDAKGEGFFSFICSCIFKRFLGVSLW